MKLQNLMTLAACVALIGSPVAKTFAQSPSPSTEAKPMRTVDPERAKFMAVRKQAMEDPDVKATLEAANKKLYEKMREIDPTLGPMIDKAEAPKGMKPKAAAAAPSASPAEAH